MAKAPCNLHFKPFNNDIIKNITAVQEAKQANPLWCELFRIYLDFMCRALFSLYHWDNLPDTMDGRYLEMTLMQDGIAGMFDHHMYGHINTRATWGELGIYNTPNESEFYAINGKIQQRVYVGKDSDNAVLVLNNAEATSYVQVAVVYARRLADIAISSGVNIDAQKTPLMLDGDYDQLEQMVRAYLQYAGGSPIIPTRTQKSKAVEGQINPLRVLNTGAPFVADKLYSQFLNVLHEFYSLVGINYANNQKAERMLRDEVNANRQEVLLSGKAGLDTRQEAAEQYNKIHGTNIKVHISVSPFDDSSDMLKMFANTMRALNSEGSVNGNESNSSGYEE